MLRHFEYVLSGTQKVLTWKYFLYLLENWTIPTLVHLFYSHILSSAKGKKLALLIVHLEISLAKSTKYIRYIFYFPCFFRWQGCPTICPYIICVTIMATFSENFSPTLIASFNSNLEAFWPQYVAILKANATCLGFCYHSTLPPI